VNAGHDPDPPQRPLPLPEQLPEPLGRGPAGDERRVLAAVFRLDDAPLLQEVRGGKLTHG
jgi:hypothetical protein